MEIILQLKGIHKSFGGLKTLTDVNMTVKKGEIHALIGPNGAGKTTLLNIISGIESLDKGTIFFKGQDISRFPPYKRAILGMGRTFQHVEVFGEMTVKENVMVGFYLRKNRGFVSYIFSLPEVKKEEKDIEKKSLEILDYIALSHKKDFLAKNLTIGEQRILEIGRALATTPELLLLDEPAAGLNIRETKTLGQLIRKIRDERGITVLVVEHDMELIMKISDIITVLNFGCVIAEGGPLEIQKNSEVIKAYLGEED